jgi:hypothetical protein
MPPRTPACWRRCAVTTGAALRTTLNCAKRRYGTAESRAAGMQTATAELSGPTSEPRETPHDDLRPTDGKPAVGARGHGQPMTTTELRQHTNRTPGTGRAMEAQDIYRALLILKRRGKVRRSRLVSGRPALWSLTGAPGGNEVEPMSACQPHLSHQQRHAEPMSCRSPSGDIGLSAVNRQSRSAVRASTSRRGPTPERRRR